MKNLVKTAFNLSVNPKQELPGLGKAWPDPAKAVLALALIPAAGVFAGALLGGLFGFGHVFGVPVLTLGLANSHWALAFGVVAYLISIATFFAGSLILEKLAPRYKAKGDHSRLAMAAVMAPGLLAGVLFVIPDLGSLAALIALWGFYILYHAVSIIFKAPKEEQGIFFGVSLILLLIAAWAITFLLTKLIGRVIIVL